MNHLRQPEQKRAGNNPKYYKTVCTLPFFSFVTTGSSPKTESGAEFKELVSVLTPSLQTAASFLVC